MGIRCTHRTCYSAIISVIVHLSSSVVTRVIETSVYLPHVWIERLQLKYFFFLCPNSRTISNVMAPCSRAREELSDDI